MQVMCDFIACYVRKVHSDVYIRSTMRKVPGDSIASSSLLDQVILHIC